jgi:hypothetical protein
VKNTTGAVGDKGQMWTGRIRDDARQRGQSGPSALLPPKDAVVGRTLASDRWPRGICQLVGERHLVYNAAYEAAICRALKELGHVLPPRK